MHNAQKSDNAQVACEQLVSLTTGHVVADSCSGLSPDTHSACTEVRVAPLKRPRDENREVATVHVARLESDCLKVTDRPRIGRLYALSDEQ